jgi:hypothetical protein
VNALDAAPASPASIAPAPAGAPSADLSLRARLDCLQDLEGTALREEWRRDGGDRLIRLTIAAQLKRAGNEMKFVIDGADDATPPDAPLVRLLTRAHSLARRLAASPGSNLEDVGSQEGMGAPYAARLMRLNYLAPDIVVAILKGRQRCGLTARKMMADTRLPLEWSEQRKALGSPEQAKSSLRQLPATAAEPGDRKAKATRTRRL